MTNPDTGLAEERAGETHMFLAHEMVHAYRMNQGIFSLSHGFRETHMPTNHIPISKGWFFTKGYVEEMNMEEYATTGLNGYDGLSENALRYEMDSWHRSLGKSGMWQRAAYANSFNELEKNHVGHWWQNQ
jgi:hypothetical protein